MRLCRRKHALLHWGAGTRQSARALLFFVSVLCSGNAGSEVRMTKQLKRGERRRATDRPMETVRLLRSYIYSGNGRTDGRCATNRFISRVSSASFLPMPHSHETTEGRSLFLPSAEKVRGKENKRAPLFSFAVAATRLNEQQCLCTPLLTLTESHVDPLAPPPYKGGRGRRKRMNGGGEKREGEEEGAEHTFAARK